MDGVILVINGEVTLNETLRCSSGHAVRLRYRDKVVGIGPKSTLAIFNNGVLERLSPFP